MKLARTFGLVLVTAAIAAALLGATSASASTQCKANESPCSEGNTYAKGTETSLEVEEGKTAVFKNSFIEIVCTASSIRGTISANPGASGEVIGTITSWTFKSCTIAGSGAACSPVETSGLSHSTHGIATGGGNGTEYVGPGIGTPGFRFGVGGTCGLVTSCSITANEAQPPSSTNNSLKATYTGSATAPTLAFNQAAQTGTFFCGGAGWRFTATYRQNSPKPEFLVP